MVQSLLIFTTGTTARITLVSYSINFIDEDNTWSVFLGLTEEVADTRGTDTDEHFSEFRTGNTEERNIGFTGYGTRHESFTSTWIAGEQDTTRNFGAEFFVFFRVLKKIDDFGKILLGGFITSDIGEKDAFFIWTVKFGTRFTEAHALLIHALSLAEHAAKEEDCDSNWDEERGNIENNAKKIDIIRIGDIWVFFQTFCCFISGLIGTFDREALIIKGASAIFFGIFFSFLILVSDSKVIASNINFLDFAIFLVSLSDHLGKRHFLMGIFTIASKIIPKSKR